LVTAADLADPGNFYFWIITIGITVAIIGILKGKIQLLFTITSFAYPNAKFNAIGNDYVKKPELEVLIEARSLNDAMGILNTRNYPLKDVHDSSEAETILDEYNIKSLKDILQDIPEGLHPLVKIYMKKYEVSIIKKLLRSLLQKFGGGTEKGGVGKHESGLAPNKDQLQTIKPVGDITQEIIHQMLDAERADEIADLFGKTPFGKDLREAIHEYDGNFQKVENILDKYVFNELRMADNKVSGTLAVPTRFFVNHLLDLSNIKMLLRAKRNRFDVETCKSMLYPPGLSLPIWKLEQMCEASDVTELIAELEGTKYYAILKDKVPDYEKSGNVSQFEIALDRYLLHMVIEIAIQHTITAGPTIRYMVSREYETRNIKTVLHGLDEGLDYKRIIPLVITEEEE
jgi:vacuolar-type H+-ATPase subunit C/Vma6